MSDKVAKALDEMLTDAADDQRRRGLIPNVTNAKNYLVPILEKVAAKETAPRTRPLIEEQKADKVLSEAKEKGLKGKWDIDRRVPKRGSKILSRLEQLLRARIRLLTTKSDWAAKLKTLNPLALNGTLGEDKRKHSAMMAMQIIEDSNRVFGDWRKEKAQKLYSK